MNGHGIPDPERLRLARAWSEARYEVLLDGRRWPLRPGMPATALERRLRAGCYLLITAWNPAFPGSTFRSRPSGPASPRRNRHADQRLRKRLAADRRQAWPAEASDGRGGWVEPGWLVAGVPQARADALARTFGQGGILYWRRGEAVALRLMWPRPAGARPCDHVDWAG